MKTKVLDVELKGIKSPRIIIRGLLYKDEEVVIKVDGKKEKYEDITYRSHNVVFKSYCDKPEFLYQLDTCSNAKKLEIIVKIKNEEKVLLEKNINKFNRLKNNLSEKCFLMTKAFKETFKMIIYILKNIKNITSKTFLNKCYKDWRYKIGLRHIEKKYYFPMDKKDYSKWLEENKYEEKYKKFDYNPLISVFISGKSKYLKECIDSILNQVYDNFEIYVSSEVLKEYEGIGKIKYVNQTNNIEFLNSALKYASGDFIALVDSNDILDKNALYEVVKTLNNDKKIDFIYTDEDKLDFNGRRIEPNFKPSFSPDTLLSGNYILHLSVVRKTLIEKVNGFRNKFEGFHEYDLFLRISEETNKIHHISKILYHSRKNNNFDNLEIGKKVIEDTLERRKISADVKVIENTNKYFVDYKLKNEPKVSIIIPTKNRSDILDKCLKSIYEKSSYKNFEIIVIDNNSDEDSLFNLLEEYKNKYDNFNSYRYECEFNYSYLNNEAVKLSTGEYVLLLNNDTEVINPDFLRIMVGYASQKHIGCVGAKLLYPTGNVQHIGVISGLGGVASHIYVNAPRTEPGYMDYLISPRNVKVVTAACFMIKKSIYTDLNGLDVKLKVAYNDVDFNVRVRNKGYYNVIVPQVELYHHESVSRGSDFTPKTKDRFSSEVEYVVKKLKLDLMNDEFYNDNFSKDFWYVLDRR